MKTFCGDGFNILADRGEVGEVTVFGNAVKADNSDILRHFFPQSAQGADGIDCRMIAQNEDGIKGFSGT